MMPGAVSGGAALLFAALLNPAAEVQHAVEIATPGSAVYTLQASDDGQRLVLVWDGGAEVIGRCSEKMLQWVDLGHDGLSASVVERNCGATVDYATQVVVEGEGLREVVAVYQGRPRVSVSWDGVRLQTRHSWLPDHKVFLERRIVAGFGVDHAAFGPAARTTSQGALDESNRGWGTHGRSVGLPDEVLLRWAGWAQQASGLYRPEWGAWDDAAPYGDDPSGRERIREGIDEYASADEPPG